MQQTVGATLGSMGGWDSCALSLSLALTHTHTPPLPPSSFAPERRAKVLLSLGRPTALALVLCPSLAFLPLHSAIPAPQPRCC